MTSNKSMKGNIDLISIIGPTAVGKTALAAQLAEKINGEILSADSRQVYRGMNLGTGKDYNDYIVAGHDRIGGKRLGYATTITERYGENCRERN